MQSRVEVLSHCVRRRVPIQCLYGLTLQVQVLTLRGEQKTCGASGACDKLRALFPREPQLCNKELTLLLLVLLDFLLFFLAFQTIYFVLEA